MRAIEVSKPNAPLQMVERPIPEPGPRQVRIKIEACGICHSDLFVVTGAIPGTKYPTVPGHEIAGRIDAIGPEVTTWRVGQRVGVGWFGGACFVCDRCRRGDFITCRNLKVPGFHYDGGYADYMIAPIDALAAIPDELDAAAAAPLLCAGITTFNSLRHSGAKPGDLVAILGIGGLGHLAVQFAVKMGFRTVAIARGRDKKELALKLGAHRYIDSQTEDAAKILKELGGAKVVLATVISGKAMALLMDGLGIDATLIVLGV
jgi:D-arabinose 1-dehydrogenase-like Zn-dependent alcohol dehydrogenase